MRRAAFLAAVLAAWAVQARAASYDIDPQHSSVNFRIRHLVSKVSGNFGKFSGTYDYEEGKPSAWKADAKIDAASINTNVEARDKHLRSSDFFDVEKCPTIRRKSTRLNSSHIQKSRMPSSA